MLTHHGLIANIMQTAAFESYGKAGATEVEAGAVPFSHCYGIVVSHLAAWRGDQFIVFPRFDMQLMLECVPKYKIERLYVVGIERIAFFDLILTLCATGSAYSGRVGCQPVPS